MPPHTKAERVPPSSFSEPSEPSELRPEDKPAETLRGEQEENPQLVAHSPGRQAGDAGSGVGVGKPSSDSENSSGTRMGRDAARRADERKREDVAGGFGVGRTSTKL